MEKKISYLFWISWMYFQTFFKAYSNYLVKHFIGKEYDSKFSQKAEIQIAEPFLAFDHKFIYHFTTKKLS